MKVERSCKIIEKAIIGDGAVYMVLNVGDMVRTSCKGPGQFVHIKCGEGLLLRRPISVCAYKVGEPEDTLDIAFEIRGEGTEWLANREVGESLDVLGFLGHGFQMEEGGRYLLVGGGIGVPPMYGCAEAAAGKSQAILGFRNKDKAILVDKFEAQCESVQIATDDGSLGYHGYVDALVKETLEKDKTFTAVLACGPKPMLRKVAEVAESLGVPCQVSMEERMGCGIGACLVCACDMNDGSRKHVCKDGPVFDSKEVNWNA